MELFRKYFLPGLIFQSVVIGGGYATGRELIEFFFAAGPIGGVLGLLTSGLIFSIVLAAGFELARVSKAYDYRQFCKALLGRGWFVFEILYICLILLILSVIGSASGLILQESLGLPPLAGTVALMVLIGVLTYAGSDIIKQFLAGWSFLLYGVYIILFVMAFYSFGGDISNTYSQADVGMDWLKSGVLYSGYNLAVLPAVLFAITAHTSRKETVGAGLIAGLLAVIPAILFYIAMMGKYPDIGDQSVPATYLMNSLNIGWLAIIFQIVVFGTFVETGTALLHAINERVSGVYEEKNKHLPRYLRPVIATGICLLAIYAASAFGIVNLIGQGYGMLTFGFIAVLVVPLLTVGSYKILKHRADV